MDGYMRKNENTKSQEQSKRVALPKEATYVFIEINRQAIDLEIYLLRARNW